MSNQKINPEDVVRDKIRSSLFIFTGCADIYDETVQFIMRGLFEYMQTLLQQATAIALKRKNAKSVSPKELLSALNGHRHYYGAKRYTILKKHARTWNELTTPVDVVLENIIDTPPAVSQMDIELGRLNDGTDAYTASERIRVRDKQIADELTEQMTVEEYLTYSEQKNAKFINNKSAFCTWLRTTMKPNDDAFSILGFLCKEYIRESIEMLLNDNARFIDDVASNKVNPIPMPAQQLPIPFTVSPLIMEMEMEIDAPETRELPLPNPFVVEPKKSPPPPPNSPKEKKDDIGARVDHLLAMYYRPQL